jgi:hypothetical protein
MLIQIINLKASFRKTQGMIVHGVPEPKMCWYKRIYTHAMFLKTSTIRTKLLWSLREGSHHQLSDLQEAYPSR